MLGKVPETVMRVVCILKCGTDRSDFLATVIQHCVVNGIPICLIIFSANLGGKQEVVIRDHEVKQLAISEEFNISIVVEFRQCIASVTADIYSA